MRDKNETIYRITVEDIYLTAESHGFEESVMTEEVVEKVSHKIEAMDFSDTAETIGCFINDAIEEIAQSKEVLAKGNELLGKRDARTEKELADQNSMKFGRLKGGQ